MDENRARRVTDALRDRGINAHLKKSGIDAYAVQVAVTGGREAVWGSEGTTGLEAEVLLDGDLVDYDEPVGRELPKAPPPAPSLPREGGVFRRFLDGFRYDSEA
jgi:hypothetical protein